MRKSIVKQAKTKDEAIRLALSEIGRSRSEVDIEVLEEGSSGFLGIGAKDAVIRVSFDENIEDSLFDFEEEIKRDSLSSEEYTNDYNVHGRSEYFRNEASALYKDETEAEEGPSAYEQEFLRENEEFEARMEDLADNNEDLGAYSRLEKINAYEQNVRGHHSDEEDLTKQLDENIGRIEDDLKNYEITHSEEPVIVEEESYADSREPIIEEIEPVVKEYDLDDEEYEDQAIIEASGTIETYPQEEKIVEADTSRTISSVTFGSVSDDIDTKKEESTEPSEPIFNEPIIEEIPADIEEEVEEDNQPSKAAYDKQQSDIDKYYRAKEFLEEILDAMHFENASVYGNLEGNTITLDAKVEENDTGIAIGKGGITLDAIELIIRKSIDSRANNLRVNVDINNYKKRRDEKIRELAADTARKVQRSKKSWNLKYMNSYERRLAHEEISKFPNVGSHSEGQEPKRYVVVTYVGNDEE